MPSTSPKQHRFMEAVAHNPTFAKKAGVPQKVGKDFAAADKRAGIGVTKAPVAPKATVAKNNAKQGYSMSTASSVDGGVGTGRMAMTTPAKNAPLPKSQKLQTAKAAAQRQRSVRDR